MAATAGVVEAVVGVVEAVGAAVVERQCLKAATRWRICPRQAFAVPEFSQFVASKIVERKMKA
jgi:hypothetical protein